MAMKAHRPMSDDMQDSELTKGMTKGQFAAWKKSDANMDSKPMSRAEDVRRDTALVKKIRRTVK